MEKKKDIKEEFVHLLTNRYFKAAEKFFCVFLGSPGEEMVVRQGLVIKG